MALTTSYGLGIGEVVLGQEFQHHVQIMEKEEIICAGSIINTLMVITTAHCLQDKVPKNLHVVAGTDDVAIFSNISQIRDVLALYTHESYDKRNGSSINDIGVLLLNEPLQYTKYVQEIKVPVKGEEFQGNVTLVGLEYESSGLRGTNNRQKKFVVPIVSNQVCIQNFSGNLIPRNDSSEIVCTGVPTTGAIKEVFGGGLVCTREDSNDTVLCGIASCGECRGTFGSPLNSVKVSRYLDWIENSATKLVEKIKCRSDEFFCLAGLNCVNRTSVCNGVDDCSEGEDEIGCVSKEPCDFSQFRCRNGNCIDEQFVCDDDNDCRDGSDEGKCPARKNMSTHQMHRCGNGRLIPTTFRCDNQFDCDDNSDEVDCYLDDFVKMGATSPRQKSNTAPSKDSCNSQSFHCSSHVGTTRNQCIPLSFQCDGHQDCSGGEDEQGCPTQSTAAPHGTRTPPTAPVNDLCDSQKFHCTSHVGTTRSQCIPLSFQCDGHQDCSGGEDERGCPTQSTATPLWTTTTTRPMHSCNSQSFHCVSHVGTTRNQCIPHGFQCDGHRDCFGGEDERGCPTQSTAAPRWTRTPPPVSDSCDSQKFHCSSHVGTTRSQCIPLSFQCDGHRDCCGGEDERGCQRQTTPSPHTRRPTDSCNSQSFHCVSHVGTTRSQCIPLGFQCDGHQDCSGGEDEQGCPTQPTAAPSSTTTSRRPMHVCNSQSFHCSSHVGTSRNQCIPLRFKCNGYRDCSGGEDERGCRRQPQPTAASRSTTTPPPLINLCYNPKVSLFFSCGKNT